MMGDKRHWMLIRCTIIVPLSLFSEILIVCRGIQCKDSPITAKAGRKIYKSCNLTVNILLFDALIVIVCHQIASLLPIVLLSIAV